MQSRPKAGFKEIANAAGVSVATVDRVFNDREGVSPRKQAAVIAAAQRLGVRRVLPEPRSETVRIEIILPKNAPGNPTPYWSRIDRTVQCLSKDLPRNVILQRTSVTEGDFAGLKAAVLRPVSRDALIIAADMTSEISEALAQLMARGQQILTIVSDVPKLAPHPFLGIDNYKAGRTAGVLMSNMVRPEDGQILLLQVSNLRQEQHDRAAGFQSVLGDAYDIRVEVTGEDITRTASALRRAAAVRPIGGIYQTGFTPGPVAEFRTTSSGTRWIAHELEEQHKTLIAEGLLDYALDQDGEAQIARAIGEALCAVQRHKSALLPRPAELRIYCRGNI